MKKVIPLLVEVPFMKIYEYFLFPFLYASINWILKHGRTNIINCTVKYCKCQRCSSETRFRQIYFLL